jgi:hypothetical protein
MSQQGLFFLDFTAAQRDIIFFISESWFENIAVGSTENGGTLIGWT